MEYPKVLDAYPTAMCGKCGKYFVDHEVVFCDGEKFIVQKCDGQQVNVGKWKGK